MDVEESGRARVRLPGAAPGDADRRAFAARATRSSFASPPPGHDPPLRGGLARAGVSRGGRVVRLAGLIRVRPDLHLAALDRDHRRPLARRPTCRSPSSAAPDSVSVAARTLAGAVGSFADDELDRGGSRAARAMRDVQLRRLRPLRGLRGQRAPVSLGRARASASSRPWSARSKRIAPAVIVTPGRAVPAAAGFRIHLRLSGRQPPPRTRPKPGDGRRETEETSDRPCRASSDLPSPVFRLRALCAG